MSKPFSVLVAVLTFNEGDRLKKLYSRFSSTSGYRLLFVDDGSTDGCCDFLADVGQPVIRHPRNLGVGAGIRTAAKYARENNDEILVIMAGNGKMLPEELDRLIDPIRTGEADYVQGSRYLEGGHSSNLPMFRHLAIKLFTFMSSLVLGFRGTDITCGYRAYKTDLLTNPAIDIEQDWLDEYELEYYLHYKVIKLGYRVIEVPVSMVYPQDGRKYSKIRPFVGWWSMVRPWVFLILGIKK